jgi:hypothetical protein
MLLVNCKKTEPVIFNTNETKEQGNDSINSFIRTIDGFEYTRLGISCRSNNLQEVKDLIAKGANINIAKKDEIYEYDALSVAIENNHIQIVDFLIKNKADVNKIYNEEGLTPIGLSTKLNEMEVVEHLMKNGADVNGVQNISNNYKSVPLIYAIENDNYNLTKLLIENGADINLCNGETSPVKLLQNKSSKWKELLKDSNKNIYKKWKGIYFYRPYSNDSDSIGNYYINIQPLESEFGFSGNRSFQLSINLQERKDTLLIFDSKTARQVGKIYKDKNQFWGISELIIDQKNKGSKNKTIAYPLKYADSADEIE